MTSLYGDAFSNEKLCEMAQGGDNAATDELMRRFSGLTAKYAMMFVPAGEEISVTKEDFMQYGLIGLWSAIKNYRDDKGATFATYASVCVRNAVYSSAKKHSSELMGISARETLGTDFSGGGYSQSAESCYFSDERLREIRALTENALSDSERTVLYLFIEGFSYREIAKRTGRSEKSVDGALQRARKKIADGIGRP